METQIKFILNDELIEEDINPAAVVLDYIRSKRLTGTKEGCKEGDCGACTVLIGETIDGQVIYKSINSCLLPVGNISGKHVVTIEAFNGDNNSLNPVQQAFVDEGASQCGFCTPGFIVSMTGYFLNEGNLKFNNVVDALDGNICRCTGHNSIIRAAEKVADRFKDALVMNGTKLKFLADNKVIPQYFLSIKDRLKNINEQNHSQPENNKIKKYFVGGGTDLFVQKPDEMLRSDVVLLQNEKNLKGIIVENGYCVIGSGSSVTEILESDLFRQYFPNIFDFIELFGSTPIRNGATIGGNLNNASPIGDMTNFFLALDSVVTLNSGKSKRDIPLNKYYLSYKKTGRKPDEFMESIRFKLPVKNYFFNFEKVSKRTYLDIASVNTSILMIMEKEIITSIHVSAGGVSAIPLYLFETSGYLIGKKIIAQNIREAVSIVQKEISPISDARGTAEYKRLLLSRLIYTHFIKLFPAQIKLEDTL